MGRQIPRLKQLAKRERSRKNNRYVKCESASRKREPEHIESQSLRKKISPISPAWPRRRAKGFGTIWRRGLRFWRRIGIVAFAFAFFLLVALPILLICGAVFLWRHRRALSAGLEFLRRRQTTSARDRFARADRSDDVIDI